MQRILTGDVIDMLRTLPDASCHMCVTSPPYFSLRDYGMPGQIGLEATPDAYVAKMVEVFAEVRRVLRDDGTLWLNLGDSYTGNASSGGAGKQDTHVRLTDMQSKPGKPKDLMMMPWRVALALQADGWYLRSVIVWAKKSPMPESVTDRPTSSWEPIFLLSKNANYYYDAESTKETSVRAGDVAGGMKYSAGEFGVKPSWGDGVVPPTRNQRNVWTLGPEPYAEAHFATFPTEIPRRAIKAGTSEKGCCPTCLAPWVRQVDKTPDNTGYANGPGGRKKEYEEHHGTLASVARWNTRTVAWAPSCDCWTGDDQEAMNPHKPIPCIVLEPFLGSGTTLAVAAQLGRHGCGIELNPEYVKLARDRIGMSEKPNTHRSEREGEAPLFADKT